MSSTSRNSIKDWHTKKIGEISLKVGSGITPKGGERVYKTVGRPFIRSQNIGWGVLLLDDVTFIDEAMHQTFDSTEIRKGDVLLNITGASIGRCAIATDEIEGGNVNQHVCIIRTEESKLNSSLLNVLLLSEKGWKQINSFQAGGNRQGLNFGQIKSFEFLIPKSIQEQTAIATTLSDTDALIISLEKLVAKKRDIKYGVMQKLLKPKKGWVWKKLIEIGEIDSDNLNSATSPDHSFKYISLEDVNLGVLRSFTEIIFKSAPSRARRKIRQDDILISTVRPNLKSHLLFKNKGSNWICSTGFSVLRCNSDIASASFIFYHFFESHINQQIEILTTGSNYPAISSKDVKQLTIPLPSIEKQIEIATILNDMDKEISILESKLQKYRQIKSGMMQNLLTGKIRLV